MRWQTVIISVFIFKPKSSFIQDDMRWMFAMYVLVYTYYTCYDPKTSRKNALKKCRVTHNLIFHIWGENASLVHLSTSTMESYNSTEILMFLHQITIFFIWVYGEQSVFNVLKHFFRGECSLSQQQIPSRIFSIIAQIAVYLLCSLFSSIYCIVKSKCQSYSEHSLWLSDRLFFYHDFASHGIVKKKSD